MSHETLTLKCPDFSLLQWPLPSVWETRLRLAYSTGMLHKHWNEIRTMRLFDDMTWEEAAKALYPGLTSYTDEQLAMVFNYATH